MNCHLRYFALMVSMLLASCTNPYKKFYQGLDREQILSGPVAAAPKEPVVLSGSGLTPEAIESDRLALIEAGYWQVGHSSFNAGSVSTRGALSVAKSIGAHLVVLYSQYSHTVNGVVPLVQRLPQRSTTNHRGSFQTGPYGYGLSGHYSGTSQTYGSATVVTAIPYAAPRYEYGATYWTKMRPPRLGVLVVDIPSDQTAALGRSSGAMVQFVLNDSPARAANLVRGDVIIRLGDREVTGQRSFTEALAANTGSEVDLRYVRRGEEHLVRAKLRQQ